MRRQWYIGWVRDAKGIIKHRPKKEISNALTTFCGNGITGKDGLSNCTPHIVVEFL